MLQELHQKIENHFNESEVRELCFKLDINYENLSGTSHKTKVIELVLHCRRREMLAELTNFCKLHRPNIDWQLVEPSFEAKSNSIQTHKYSGTWKVQNKFTRWRRRDIQEPDEVFFYGTTLLIISKDGQEGSGVQIGKLQVRIKDYRATYEIVNEVQRATVIQEEMSDILRMHVKVIRRRLIKESPSEKDDLDNTYSDLREDLEHRGFDLILKSVPDKPNQLKGDHVFEVALKKIQIASEVYNYHGLFITPSL